MRGTGRSMKRGVPGDRTWRSRGRAWSRASWGRATAQAASMKGSCSISPARADTASRYASNPTSTSWARSRFAKAGPRSSAANTNTIRGAGSSTGRIVIRAGVIPAGSSRSTGAATTEIRRPEIYNRRAAAVYLSKVDTLRTVILASASPRRRALLSSLGLNVCVVASRYEEVTSEPLPPRILAARHARGKALGAELDGAPGELFARGSPLVAADTVVDVDGTALGKPQDEAQGRAMLRTLSGREHQVHTAFFVRTPDGRTAEHTETTTSRRTSLPATARIKPAGMGSKASAPRWSSVSTATFIRSWASRLEPSCAAFGDSVGPCASTMPQRLHSHESVQHASLDVESRYRDRSGDGEYGRLRARAWDDRLGAVGRRLRRGGADRRARSCGEGPRRARPGRDPGRPSLARRDDIGLQGGASSHQSDRRACARWSVLGRAAGRRFGPRVRNRYRVQGGRGGGPCRWAQEHRLRPARSRCGDRRGTRYHRAAGPDGRRYRRRDDGDRGLGADRCRRARIDQGRGRHVRCRDHEPPAGPAIPDRPLDRRAAQDRTRLRRSALGTRTAARQRHRRRRRGPPLARRPRGVGRRSDGRGDPTHRPSDRLRPGGIAARPFRRSVG